MQPNTNSAGGGSLISLYSLSNLTWKLTERSLDHQGSEHACWLFILWLIVGGHNNKNTYACVDACACAEGLRYTVVKDELAAFQINSCTTLCVSVGAKELACLCVAYACACVYDSWSAAARISSLWITRLHSVTFQLASRLWTHT